MYKLVNNTKYRKTIENLRNGIDVNLVSNQKYFLKPTSTKLYLAQNTRRLFSRNTSKQHYINAKETWIH